MILITERERQYKKQNQKRVVINLLTKDYDRWNSYAHIRGEPLATVVRKAVEAEIAETEDSFGITVADLQHQQDLLKE